MTNELPTIDELERRLVAGCYPDRARVLRRRWPLATGGIVLTCCAAAAALLLASSSVTTPAAAALAAAAAAAGQGPPQAPLVPGQYWYTQFITSDRTPVAVLAPGAKVRPAIATPSTGGGHAPPAGRTELVWFNVKDSVETWIGTDGTLRTRTIELSRTFATAADRARWAAADRPSLPPQNRDVVAAGDGWFPPQLSGTGPDVGDGLFSYTELVSLPTDRTALSHRLEQARAAFAQRQSATLAQALHNVPFGQHVTSADTSISPSTQASASTELLTVEALLATPVTTPVRVGLFRMLTALPGVRYDGPQRDPLGRPGAAVSVGSGRAQERLFFNPQSGAFLASTLGADHSSAVVVGAIVGSIRTTPATARPVTSPSGLVAQTASVAPRVGTPTTTLTITLPRGAGRAQASQQGGFVLLSGPTGSGCQASLPIVVRLRRVGLVPTIPASAARGTTYRLAPQDAARNTWCPGRYKISAPATVALYFEVN